ncbi:tRNA 2-thiouridine(34) synthase MnmA [candidate division LCP-89 bacterium B3_LCP]|uniref:tRNA-specific 2-thiouridylase MnmA n=1 Tax=candidate division LCP-89 bacterium B3_LCP TaxID=2012998 RepID=A0A532UY03_UNCL8|nr:MAG: tRNA 2-thiouridine(34) synthase MnmA [candidate division LCP-89 bacterium B3_LCP]
MSGGVDSSVTAALLKDQGYDVVGLTMKLFDKELIPDVFSSERGCCNIDAIGRARSVCHLLGIPHYPLDFAEDFFNFIVEDFIDEYLSGRTPNPCIRCNSYLKWGKLFDKAKMLGCDKIATGHYARIAEDSGSFKLLRANSRYKDQSYALWGIPRDRLADTLLPLGTYSKTQVRKVASRLKLKSAETPESQEICFVPDGHYVDFLKEQKPQFFADLGSGELVCEGDEGLQKLGEHPGFPHYTVGQRKGLGGGFPDPRYVIRIEPESNRVVIGAKEKLYARTFHVDQVNWLIPVPAGEVEADVQIRYRSGAFPAVISPLKDSDNEDKRWKVEFTEPVEAITPGQSAVFYFNDERLIGGGRIREVLPL